jgi:hypothetical protein
MDDYVVKSFDILLKDNLIRNLQKKLHQNQTKYVQKHVCFKSGEVYCPHRWLRHYTSPDNSIGEQFPQE